MAEQETVILTRAQVEELRAIIHNADSPLGNRLQDVSSRLYFALEGSVWNPAPVPVAAVDAREQEVLTQDDRNAIGHAIEAVEHMHRTGEWGDCCPDYVASLRKIDLALASRSEAPAARPNAAGQEQGWPELFEAANEALELTRLHGGPKLLRLFEAVRAIQCNQSGG